MAKYFCDFCELPINEDTIEVGYDGKRLLRFHPITCVKDPNSHKCPSNYFNLHTELKQLPTAFYTTSELEIMSEDLIIQQLLKIQNKTSD